jgi:hypothetical protein
MFGAYPRGGAIRPGAMITTQTSSKLQKETVIVNIN